MSVVNSGALGDELCSYRQRNSCSLNFNGELLQNFRFLLLFDASHCTQSAIRNVTKLKMYET